jgi:Lipocalin-like domain
MAINPLLGTWRLVSFEVRSEGGSIEYPFGREPVGYINYSAEGHMSVQLARADRANLAEDDWLTAPDAEIVEAARDYVGYAGTYELRDGEVVHSVTVSLIPNWVGTQQVRRLAIDGDKITLSTPQISYGGPSRIASLVWQRMERSRSS